MRLHRPHRQHRYAASET